MQQLGFFSSTFFQNEHQSFNNDFLYIFISDEGNNMDSSYVVASSTNKQTNAIGPRTPQVTPRAVAVWLEPHWFVDWPLLWWLIILVIKKTGIWILAGFVSNGKIYAAVFVKSNCKLNIFSFNTSSCVLESESRCLLSFLSIEGDCCHSSSSSVQAIWPYNQVTSTIETSSPKSNTRELHSKVITLLSVVFFLVGKTTKVRHSRSLRRMVETRQTAG